MNKTQLLYEALKAKYQAQIAGAKATLAIYFESSVGIGEHPQHIEEIKNKNINVWNCTRLY